MKRSYTVVVDVAYFNGQRLTLGKPIMLSPEQARHLVALGQLRLTSEMPTARGKAK